jgi:site-specific DNA-methyltransferase (adenine-specific)/site-specific DNA-methyltransferase (cytosine-N4-specific)
VNRADELQKQWQTEAGQIWRIGPHTLICADCRQPETWQRLLNGSKVNGVFTSPPYAEQRKEQYGGVPTDEYVDWWQAVQDNVRANLADDGSFFVNIKAHCEDGQRVLYVMDLVLAMARDFGWRFIEEFCWLRNPTPKQVIEHFKQGFEPVYQFSLGKFKFNPEAVRHASDNVPIPGGEGTGNTNWAGRQGRINALANTKGNHIGMAYPSTVLDFAKLGGQVEGHSAAFPVALPDFFIRAYSDPGDVWLDPFVGSGTTMIAAQQNGRIGLGIERLPAYCAVILERFAAIGVTPELVSDAVLEGA